MGEDLVCPGWELSCGFSRLWNAACVLQGTHPLQLSGSSSPAGAGLCWFQCSQRLLVYFSFLTCPRLSADLHRGLQRSDCWLELSECRLDARVAVAALSECRAVLFLTPFSPAPCSVPAGVAWRGQLATGK